MPEDIVYIRLINGDQIIGRLHEEQTDTVLLVSFPMLLENKTIDGSHAINLVKYLPFTNQHQQVIALKKDHIVTMNDTNSEFQKYYHLTLEYQMTYMEPYVQQNIKAINNELESALEINSQKFVEALKQYANQIPLTISTKVH